VLYLLTHDQILWGGETSKYCNMRYSIVSFLSKDSIMFPFQIDSQLKNVNGI